MTKLIVDRMTVLSNSPHLADELTDSLKNSLQFFFNDTLGTDREYLTKAATNFVDQMRGVEAKRIQESGLNNRAAMSLIRHVGKIMSHLPEAIKQILKSVTFNPEAPPMRFLSEDEAEFEEDDDQEVEEAQPEGMPASGTPPGTPPEWNPREGTASTFRTGRVKEAVQRIEGPQTSSIPATKWQGWKTKTGPTIADVEQSRMSPLGDPESEMPDPELREAMMRSLHETRHDPQETPDTGGASGSGGAMASHYQQRASPPQAGTPTTQSDGEGSLLPNRPPSIAIFQQMESLLLNLSQGL